MTSFKSAEELLGQIEDLMRELCEHTDSQDLDDLRDLMEDLVDSVITENQSDLDLD